MLRRPFPVTQQGPYVANAVNFDGSTSISRGADLDSITNTKLGIFSGWVRMGAGTDGNQYTIFNSYGPNDGISLMRDNSPANKLYVLHRYNDAGAICWGAYSAGTITVSSGWAHILMAWDLANTTAQIYLDDSLDAHSNTHGPLNQAPLYSRSDHHIGIYRGASFPFVGDMADIYINTDEYLDISVEANRRKFIDGDGKPVYLGADGELPTGNQPSQFFSGETDTWHVNKGYGGGFTESGTLTTASTSPSD